MQPALAHETTDDLVSKEKDLFSVNSMLNALILDDNKFDRRRLMRTCQESGLNMRFDEVSMVDELKSALDNNRYDIAFIDYVLPDGTGLQAVHRLLSHPAHTACATIMIAGQGDVDVAVAALKKGCSDYVEKANLTPNAIRRAVTNATQKANLQKEVNQAHGFQEAMTRVLDNFAQECETDIKPVLSRMLRTIRSGGNNGDEATQKQKLEESCRELWDCLEHIRKYTAKV